MSIISISVIKSDDELVAGIPKTVSISTSIPATIFYTLNGVDPTIFSDIYISPINLPTNKPSVVLKIFATNGVDNSVIITEEYSPSYDPNSRLPFSGNLAPSQNPFPIDPSPFGTNPTFPNQPATLPGTAGTTIYRPYDPNEEELTLGYGAEKDPNSFVNQDPNNLNYKYVSSENKTENYAQIGTLPPIDVLQPIPPPEQAHTDDKLFDPKAYVIYQDVRKEDPNDPAFIHSQYFTLEDPNKVSDGNLYFNCGQDVPAPSGAFVKQHFNSRENTMTYYFWDSKANKWMIVTTAYNPANNPTLNMSGMFFNRNQGIGKVFEWQMFQRRVLF